MPFVLHNHVPVSTILGTLSALEALCDYALYKSTFTLHYIISALKHCRIHSETFKWLPANLDKHVKCFKFV